MRKTSRLGREARSGGSVRLFSLTVLILLAWMGRKADPDTTALGANPVQFDLPGNFLPPFDQLNNIPPSGLDLDGNGTPDLRPPCSCRNNPPVQNGTNPNSALFDDQLIVATGISGQSWKLVGVQGLFHPVSGQALVPNTSIPEVGNTGIYVLPVAHRDANGYFAQVQSNAYPGQTFGPVVNTCYYPDPVIENYELEYCTNMPDVTFIGSATSDFDNNNQLLAPGTENWTILRLDDNTTFQGPTFRPATFGPGRYRISYTFDAGPNAHFNANKTGCATTVRQEVEVRGPASFGCNTQLNVTLNPNSCVATIVPEMVLANDLLSTENFSVEVFGPGGISLGDQVSADYVGETLFAQVTDDCFNESCSTQINLLDVHKPNLQLPPDQFIACYEEADSLQTGQATATDCSPVVLSYVDQLIDKNCADPAYELRRIWTATDAFGNTDTKTQIIYIRRFDESDLRFPRDTLVTCADYTADSTLPDPAVGKGGLPSFVTVPECELSYSFQDDTVDFCAGNVLIQRTWFVFNNCTNEVYFEDGLGNDNIQILQIRDETPPVLLADTLVLSANLRPQDNGLADCSSTGFIPPPFWEDACSGQAEITILTPLGELDYANGTNGNAGGNIPFPGLPLGVHTLTYRALDPCNNFTEITGIVEVVDTESPLMICDNFITVTLDNTGSGFILPEFIDEGSRDNCCDGPLQIKLTDEPDSLFRDVIDLQCIADTLEVVLRMYDCAGNFNECVADARIRDIIGPTLTNAPPNAQVSCLTDPQPYLQAGFQSPTITDNCEAIVDFSVSQNLDSCGIGTVVRTWQAVDNAGNGPVQHTQTVTFEADFDYQWSVPEDQILICSGLAEGEILAQGQGCEQLGIDLIIDTLFNTPDTDSACYYVIRNHFLTNGCEYDGSSQPLLLPRQNEPLATGYELRSDGQFIYRVTANGDELLGPSTGYYQYTQLVRVYDNEVPVISGGSTKPICAFPNPPNSGPCTGLLSYNFTVADDCVDELTVVHDWLDDDLQWTADPFGTLVQTGPVNFNLSGNYPLGNHSIRIRVNDPCGNLAEQILPVEVRDCTPPQLNCATDTAFVILDGDNGLIISPQDLLNGAIDNCSSVSLFFDAGQQVVSQTYFCDDAGMYSLSVWGVDASGNQSSCTATFSVVEGGGCAAFFDLAGRVRKADVLDPVSNVVMSLSGDWTEATATGADGSFSFPDIPGGSALTLTATKDDHPANGVTTLDILRIRRHILNVELLESPYQKLASDVNASKTISTLDLVFIQRVILGLDPGFPGVDSWEFIPQDFQFTDDDNPFLDDMPAALAIPPLLQDVGDADFWALKMGDVNGSAAPGPDLVARKALPEWPIDLPDAQLQPGERLDVRLQPEGDELQGYQFGLWVDPFLLELEAIYPSDPLLAVGRQRDDCVPISWYRSGEQEAPELLLRVRARRAVRLSEAIRLRDACLPAEVYDASLQVFAPRLNWRASDPAAWEVLPFAPNPASGQSQLWFYQGAAGPVSFTCWSLDGQPVRQQVASFSAGWHAIQLSAQELPGPGLYVYQLRSEAGTYSGKLVVSP